MKRKKRKSKLPVIMCLVVAAIVVAAGCYFMTNYSFSNQKMDSSSYFGIDGDNEAAVIVDGKLLETKAYAFENKIYLPYTVLTRYTDAGFYFEESQNMAVLTTESNEYSWKINDSDDVFITDSEGNLYIDPDTAVKFADIEISSYDDPARLVMVTDFTGYTVSVLKDTQVRYSGSKKSPIITEVKEGDTLILGEEDGEWTQVSTKDGYTGYILSECIEISSTAGIDHKTVCENTEFNHILMDETVACVWQYVDNQENNDIMDYLLEGSKGVNVISPTWFDLSDDYGNIRSYVDMTYMDKAKNLGLSVWAMVADTTGDGDAEKVISSDESRAALVKNLIEQCTAAGVQGINVDFELITSDYADDYIQFLKELTKAAHQYNMIVSVDDYVPTYTKYYNRSAQAKVVDYIIVMAYDEHTGSSEEAGSTASISFVKDGIEETLLEVPSEQLILGVPFYTRGWTQNKSTLEYSVDLFGMTEAEEFIKEHGMTLKWNEECGQNVGNSEDSENYYSIWMEDEDSLEEKLELVNEYSLAGASAWRLGNESADIWDIWQKYLG